MTLSGATARFELSATATPTGTLVAGTNVIGRTLQTARVTAADIITSIRVSGVASDIANISLTTLVGSVTAGSPTFTDGDGNDFEGIDIDPSTIYGVLVEHDSAGSDTVVVTGTNKGGEIDAGGAWLLYHGSSGLPAAGFVTLNFNGTSIVDVTILASA